MCPELKQSTAQTWHVTMFRPIARRFATKTTIDPKQLPPFNQLSEVWWKINGQMKPLHAMNGLRIPWIQNRLTEIGAVTASADPNAPLKGLSILDVGCGGGIVSEPLTELGAKVVGIDCNLNMLNVARSRNERRNYKDLKYLHSTIEEHVLGNRGRYDVVVASEVIEHVKEQEMFVKNCIGCLKPGGSFFVTTNSKSWTSKILFINLLEDVLRTVPKGTHEYDMFIDVKDLTELVKKENCKVLFTSGMFYNPVSNKWFMIKNHHMLHYIVHAVKLS